MKKVLDWNEYSTTVRQAIAEGCVLLENRNDVLPLKKDSKVAVFGRIQNSYYKSGTGSGGMVNVAKVYDIVEGLIESGHVIVNEKLRKIYADWIEEHPYDEGMGWGKERWSQDEMPLTEDIVKEAADESDIAIVIIGRTAGEDKDASDTPGSYQLTEVEKDMLIKVRAAFDRMVVLLNVGSIIDMSFVDFSSPDAVMYVWQGGMLGGLGTADALIGATAPSGKLTDTVAYAISDYPSDEFFGVKEKNYYCEDIFIGYRYFESFSRDTVRYPFGYGLTYTEFLITANLEENNFEDRYFKVNARVKNIKKSASKEVVQVYVEAPCGKLGKASKVLVDFAKTKTLEAGEEEIVTFAVPYERFASYDDSGVTEHKSCFVLEEGEYTVFVGNDVRNAREVGSFVLEKLVVISEHEEALAPIETFKRMHCNEKCKIVFEETPMATASMTDRRADRIPEALSFDKDKVYKLADVVEGKLSVEEFVAQLSDEDLSCIIRGEGMGSTLVTPGTASAFGGVSDKLINEYGIPSVCCDDGPSGMRLDCGIKAFSLPNGVMLASTFNEELVTELYSFTGLEMVYNKVDNLLGPGMNIHRHPLNGRNFEYFSEDPLVTGLIGTAMIKGLRSAGVTGTMKHFCGNNQEFNRRDHNSVISERALREIYLKGFEIAVKSGYANSVMTTYGMVNGLFTAGSYDLNTTILRDDWGFEGIVMTDWWAHINELGKPKSGNNFAAMVRSQNDLYMVCPDGSKNATGDNTISSLADGTLTRGELQRCAVNICKAVMDSEAMRRLMGVNDEVEIINRQSEADDVSADDVEFMVINGDAEIDLTYQECKANTNYVLALDVQTPGTYEVTLVGSSDLEPLAQLPCTLFFSSIPVLSFAFRGSNGETTSISKETKIMHRFCVARLFVARNGLKLTSIKLKHLNDDTSYEL